MARETRQPFNPTGKYVARKELTFNGVKFLPGDPFDPVENNCDAEKLRKLYESNFLTAPENTSKLAAGKTVVKKKKTAAKKKAA